jgi:hypothetical protein
VKGYLSAYINLSWGGLQVGVECFDILPFSFGVHGRCYKLTDVKSDLNEVWIVPQDFAMCEYGHSCSPDRGTDEPSSGCAPPALSPWDQGLHRDILGCSTDSNLGESCAASWLEVMGVEEVEASSTLIRFHAPSGLGGLSTFGDSPPSGTLLAEVTGSISWGTLHEGSRLLNVRQWKMLEIGSPARSKDRDSFSGTDGGVDVDAMDAGSLILIPP